VCAYDAVADDNLSWAPPAMIAVSDPGSFRGSVQLNAEMTLAG